MKILFMVLSVLFVSVSSYASSVFITGAAYSSDNCQYYSTSLADLNINIKTPAPWGSQLVLRYGFHDTFSNTDWMASSQVEMVATAAYIWTATLKGVEVDSRGSTYFDQIQFDFEVIQPDGSVAYDNGGSSYGYYQAELPSRACQAGSPAQLNSIIINR